MYRLLIVVFFAALALCVPAQNAQAAIAVSSVRGTEPQFCMPIDPLVPAICLDQATPEPKKEPAPGVTWTAIYQSDEGDMRKFSGRGFTCLKSFKGPTMLPPDPEAITTWTRISDCAYTFDT